MSQKVVLSEFETASEDTSGEEKLHARPKNDGLQSLLRLLQNYFWPENMDIDEEVHKKTQMPSSAYVSSYKVTSLKNKVSSASVIVEKTEGRFLRHIVAVNSYYGYPTSIFDAVMVKVDNAETISTSKEGEFPVWWAEVFAFIRVCRVHAKSTVSFPQNSKSYCL